MEIKIQVLSTQIETKPTQKGSYQVVDVAYKDMSNGGKVGSKKVMSFTNKDVFNTISVAKPTEFYDVTMEKGEKYWEWTKVSKASAPSANSAEPTTSKATASSATSKGGWETPEERAKKQIYIIRQSSVSSAVAALSAGVKTPPTSEAVIEYAMAIEKYVLGVDDAATVAKQDVSGFADLEDPIPF